MVLFCWLLKNHWLVVFWTHLAWKMHGKYMENIWHSYQYIGKYIKVMFETIWNHPDQDQPRIPRRTTWLRKAIAKKGHCHPNLHHERFPPVHHDSHENLRSTRLRARFRRWRLGPQPRVNWWVAEIGAVERSQITILNRK